jgi:hypothetical protein
LPFHIYVGMLVSNERDEIVIKIRDSYLERSVVVIRIRGSW